MSKIGVTSPKIEGRKTTYFRHFRQLRNIIANCMANVLGMKHDIENPGKAMETTLCLKTTTLM